MVILDSSALWLLPAGSSVAFMLWVLRMFWREQQRYKNAGKSDLIHVGQPIPSNAIRDGHSLHKVAGHWPR